jgi:hypothetical protein
MVTSVCQLSYTVSANRKIVVQASLGINGETLIKYISKAKRARAVVQLVQCLPSKHNAISSNPNGAKKKPNKKKPKI